MYEVSFWIKKRQIKTTMFLEENFNKELIIKKIEKDFKNKINNIIFTKLM